MFRKTTNECAAGATAEPVMVICLALWLALFAMPAFGQVGHIHELYYNNSSWTDSDLTTATGATSASSFAGMAAYTFAPVAPGIWVATTKTSLLIFTSFHFLPPDLGPMQT